MRLTYCENIHESPQCSYRYIIQIGHQNDYNKKYYDDGLMSP